MINDTTNTQSAHVLAHMYVREINARRLTKQNAWDMLKEEPQPSKLDEIVEIMKPLVWVE